MAKQTIYLFMRALIIGILLNVGLYLISDPPPASQTNVQAQQQATGQTSSPIQALFLGHPGN